MKKFHRNVESALGHRLRGMDAAIFYTLALLFIGLLGVGLTAVYAETSNISLVIASAFGVLMASTLAWVYVNWSRMAALLLFAFIFTLIFRGEGDE